MEKTWSLRETSLIPGDQVQIEMDSQDIEKLYEPLRQYGKYLLDQIAYFIQISPDIVVGQFIVLQITGKVFVIRCHIDEAMAGQVEQDDFLFARFLAFICFADSGCNGVAGFRVQG